jgi:hypothetical protein
VTVGIVIEVDIAGEKGIALPLVGRGCGMGS